MTITTVLYDIIIAPIEYIIELIFCFILSGFPDFGMLGAIIGISLAVNFLALPLYLKADELQLAERKTQEKMGDRIQRIKKAFQGDEQFMMLSEYYRRNDYHPLYALRSSLSILIEIPFFIAAYHFLSNCVFLNGWSEWIFQDLSQPDGLLVLPIAGGITLNLLPILMTLINFISTAVYTKGAPIREKAQAYILALVFLVILYASPCGLVFYWILNNLFSLLKNMAMKLKHPVYALYGAISVLLASFAVYFHLHPDQINPTRQKVIDAATVLWIMIPVFLFFAGKLAPWIKKQKITKWLLNVKQEGTVEKKGNTALMVASCIALWFLAGALVPSSVIATSPTEFSFLGSVDSPLTYIFMNLTFYFGLFVFWPICIYKMFQKQTKNVLPILFFGLTVCAVCNVYLYQSQFGNITTAFEPENKQLFVSTSNAYVLSALLPILVIVIICFAAIRFQKLQLLTLLLTILIVSEGIISGQNLFTIKKGYEDYALRLEERQTDDSTEDLKTEFSLTRTGKNVLVLFCDRLTSAYFPYVMEQFPEWKDSYDGFTYYPNCISFAMNTMVGSPSMMGGYDYTPLAMNQSERQLVDLHNEAILTLPVFFNELGYDVKVADPPYVNYQWEGDYTPFEQYPDIEVCSLVNNYVDRYEQEHREDYTDIDYGKISIKNCRLFSMVQMIYPPLRNVLIGKGRYYSTDNYVVYYQQESFMKSYSYMTYLPAITDAENDRNTYTFIELEIAHEYQMLLEPDYRSGLPTEEHPYAGIGSYPEAPSIVDPEQNIQSYHVNACAIRMLGEYLDALKEMGVYDNTRIIIVADHGSKIATAPFFDYADPVSPSSFNPMLLVKDFNSTGEVRTDMTLHTNADTPYFATEGLGVPQINPFTGNPFTLAREYEYFDVYEGDLPDSFYDRDATQFVFFRHFTIRDNIFDEANWSVEE